VYLIQHNNANNNLKNESILGNVLLLVEEKQLEKHGILLIGNNRN
jgi:hypothetical protein